MNRGWIVQCHDIEDYKVRDKAFTACVYTQPEAVLVDLLDQRQELYEQDANITVKLPTIKDLMDMPVGTFEYAVYDSNYRRVLAYSCVKIS